MARYAAAATSAAPMQSRISGQADAQPSSRQATIPAPRLKESGQIQPIEREKVD